MPASGDDKVGWDAVGPEFRETVRDRVRRADTLFARLQELPGVPQDSPNRVRVWQEIRELDVLPQDQVFYLIAWELAAVASERNTQLYSSKYEPQLRSMYEAHGIDFDDLDAIEEWTEQPDEMSRLEIEMDRDEDRIREEVYREFGENEMATLWRDNRKKFDERWQNGREMVHPGLDQRIAQLARGEIEPEELFRKKT